ncbi:Holliday junction resolvase RecU [Bacillus fonticola]|uniref:Holliday junction resolvase RecU n=1 Tax=Bacillus fonticola TaxID=2728853 RepID=UPI00147473D4|nr:Holliday junction resolvase RecU [Bacillus fonticola]
MSIRYPNGKPYKGSLSTPKQRESTHRYGNRGKTLEDDLNATNHYYREHGIAIVHKKPTPIQVVSVDYPKRSAAVIKEAYFRQPSTTDYNGVYKGLYLDFEAKETTGKTAFPLANIHEHQIGHMKQVLHQSGVCFFILRFTATDEVYYMPGYVVITYWERMVAGGRKSMKKEEVERDGYKIPLGLSPRVDYIKIVDELHSPS